jgi:DNA-directed RNA polymerase subunit RPC12/RpoP
MSEIAFVLDANALARIFYDDIGKNNLEKILTHPDSKLFTPEIGIIETVSALLAACNDKMVSQQEYRLAISALYNMIEDGDLTVLSPAQDYIKDCIAILEQYKIQPGKAFNGVDSMYILTSRLIADAFPQNDCTVVFVTSDNYLYNACSEEDSFETFHLWTCDLGCGHTEFIPKKYEKDRPAKYKKCANCGSKVLIEQAKESSNRCPKCGKRCAVCIYNACLSTYKINFEKWS